MTEASTLGLVSLEDSDITLARPSDDIRGFAVVDPYQHRVGEVDGLIVDEEQRRARLLVVSSGGILGLERRRRLVPVDAVTRVDDAVHIEASHERVRSACDPDVRPAPAYDAVYDHFGYKPFWDPDHVQPYFLRRCGGE